VARDGTGPDINATSTSVIATVTALAASPTYPPTATRRPVGSAGDAPPTPPPPGEVVTLLSISAQVYRGGAASISVRARPSDTCRLSLLRSSDGEQTIAQPSDAVRRAGSDGVVAWIWSIPDDAPLGLWRVQIVCSASGTAQYDMSVLP